MDANYDRSGNRIVLSRIFAAMILAAVLMSVDAWHDAAPLIEHSLSLLAWLLVGLGVTGRIWCSIYIAGQKNSALVVEGPYSICRNPLYLFSFVGGLGVVLTSEILLLALFFTVAFWPYYLNVVADEERKLLGRHGAVFEDYRSRVPRFWPRFSLYSEPARYTVSPAVLRKHIRDAAWFVIAAAIVAFIGQMQHHSYLPYLWNLY